jgi:hypothetical protein
MTPLGEDYTAGILAGVPRKIALNGALRRMVKPNLPSNLVNIYEHEV